MTVQKKTEKSDNPPVKTDMITATHSQTPETNKKAWQQARSCRDVTDGKGNIIIPHLG